MPLTWEELESKVEEVGNLALMAFLSIVILGLIILRIREKRANIEFR